MVGNLTLKSASSHSDMKIVNSTSNLVCHQIQSNVNICELHCLRFQNFMISNFNATVLAFLGCFGDTTCLLISFVSVNMVDCFHAYGKRLYFNHSVCFVLPKSVSC
jgi:hypothetical protein